jgi:hypothetical protein
MNNTGGGEIRRGKVQGLTGNFLLVPKQGLGNEVTVAIFYVVGCGIGLGLP